MIEAKPINILDYNMITITNFTIDYSYILAFTLNSSIFVNNENYYKTIVFDKDYFSTAKK